METVDEEFLKATLDFIDRAAQEKKPFFAWFNPSRIHIWPRLKPEAQGKTGLGICSARSNGSERRLNSFGARSGTKGCIHTSNPCACCSRKTALYWS
jgi:hypothetical protein